MASFKSILKKIGEVANTASAAIPIYGTLIKLGMAPFLKDTDVDKLDKVDKVMNIAQDGLLTAMKIVLDAEVMGQAIGAPGAQKAAMIAPAMQSLLNDLPILKGKKPKDEASAKLKAQAFGAALADYFNEFTD